MIPDSEIRRRAQSDGVEPVIVERDYVLGWVLAGCFGSGLGRGSWVFKGGTCLKKCYFKDYRFSEDLDFTLTGPVTPTDVEGTLQGAARWAEEASGIRLTDRPIRHEVISEGTRQETYRFWLYYRGPHRQVGDQSAIKVDLTFNEEILLPPVERPLIHPYSDQDSQGTVKILSYSLEEVLAEKARAMSGQRRFAISRDPFDIDQIVKRGADALRASGILRKKCAAKGVDIETISAEMLSGRKEAFRRDWETNLSHLLPLGLRVSFEESWEGALKGMESMWRDSLGVRS